MLHLPYDDQNSEIPRGRHRHPHCRRLGTTFGISVVREELHMDHFAHLSHAVLATTVSYGLREILGKVMGNIWGIYQQHLEIINFLYIKKRFWKLLI